VVVIAFRIFSVPVLLLLGGLLLQGQDTVRPPQPGELARDLTAPHVTVANVQDQSTGRVGRWWIASMFAVGGATAADAATSWGKLESNSILASKNGTFGMKGVEIKAALAAGILVPQILLRKHTELRRTFLIGNTGAAVLFTTAAVHNTRIPD
jgi:hypothetical protein